MSAYADSIKNFINESLVTWDNDESNRPDYFSTRFIRVLQKTSTDWERYYLGRGYDIGIDVAKFVAQMMIHEILRSSHENDRNINSDDIFFANDKVISFFKDLHDQIYSQPTDNEIPF